MNALFDRDLVPVLGSTTTPETRHICPRPVGALHPRHFAEVRTTRLGGRFLATSSEVPLLLIEMLLIAQTVGLRRPGSTHGSCWVAYSVCGGMLGSLFSVRYNAW